MIRYDVGRGNAARSELRELFVGLTDSLEMTGLPLPFPLSLHPGPELEEIAAAVTSRLSGFEQLGGAVLAVLDGVHDRTTAADGLTAWESIDYRPLP